MANIDNMSPRSGRILKEDNTVINIADNGLPVQLTGSNLTQDPETGNKTITATAAEVFAGQSPLTGRNKLLVYNASQEVVKWGKGTIDTNTGFSLLPGDSIVFSFKPETYVPIFFVATTDSVVEVGELA